MITNHEPEPAPAPDPATEPESRLQRALTILSEGSSNDSGPETAKPKRARRPRANGTAPKAPKAPKTPRAPRAPRSPKPKAQASTTALATLPALRFPDPHIIVLGKGDMPSPVMFIGEAPGREEARCGVPFIGQSGYELRWYLSAHNTYLDHWYITNIVKTYLPGNPDPTPALIDFWSPSLISEIRECNPKLIVAVGRFAARWLLGSSLDMEMVHGLPHTPGCFDPQLAARVPSSTIIIPAYHPALGIHDPNQRAIIDWDYEQVSWAISAISKGYELPYVWGSTRASELLYYTDLAQQIIEPGSDQLSQWFAGCRGVIGLDTEGSTIDCWSVQLSFAVGQAIVARSSVQWFGEFIALLSTWIFLNPRIIIAVHNAMYDLSVCLSIGLDLSRANIFDTMYAAYLTRILPQGLKPSTWRLLGIRMRSYLDTIGSAARAKQIEYLTLITEIPDTEIAPVTRAKTLGDGSVNPYKPSPIQNTARRLLIDISTGKLNNKGEPVDPAARFKKFDPYQRKQVIARLGDMPVATLSDIPLDEAIQYSAQDADVTRQGAFRYFDILESMSLMPTMRYCMDALPIFWQIQHNGMFADRDYFLDLYDEFTERMDILRYLLSTQYFGGQKFNPKSPRDVTRLINLRGLVGAKMTKSGLVSTSKGSIEHLRDDPAIDLAVSYREVKHLRDSFCTPVINRTNDPSASPMPGTSNIYRVTCQIKTTRTATRRIASTNPNLLAIPSRNALGRKIRRGYVSLPGYLYGAADLSQIEICVLADESKDDFLIHCLLNGLDIHYETASRLFGVPVDQITKDQRRAAKTSNFGVIYGMQDEGLLTQLRIQRISGWTKQDCGRFIRMITREIYPGIGRYAEETEALVSRTPGCIVRDHWGMPRRVPGIRSKNLAVRAEAIRIAVSHRIQGTAQGMAQQAMIYADSNYILPWQRSGIDITWNMQIHDEVILHYPEEHDKMVSEAVVYSMSNGHGHPLVVPVKSSWNSARTWEGLK